MTQNQALILVYVQDMSRRKQRNPKSLGGPTAAEEDLEDRDVDREDREVKQEPEDADEEHRDPSSLVKVRDLEALVVGQLKNIFPTCSLLLRLNFFNNQ